MAKAISTYGVALKWGSSGAGVTAVVDIKSFPDLGGPPNMIEVTTLADAMQTFIAGIQSSGEMAFTCNYTKAKYILANSTAGTPMHYEITFGTEGAFIWQGTHSIHLTGGGVNDPVEMVVTVAPSTKPTLKA